VTGGPRSFVEVARNFEDFPRAVRKKLLQEVAERGPRSDFDTGALQLHDGAQLAQGERPRRVREDDDYTKFVKPSTNWAATSASGAAANFGSAASGSRRTELSLLIGLHAPATSPS